MCRICCWQTAHSDVVRSEVSSGGLRSVPERGRRCHPLCTQELLDSMASANEPHLSEEVWLV